MGFNKNILALLLVVALLVLVLANACLAYQYSHLISLSQQAQAQIAISNQNRAAIQSLATEAIDFSRRNRSLEPVLQSAGILPTNMPMKVAK